MSPRATSDHPPIDEESPDRWRTTFAPLRVRSFRLFLTGQVFTSAGGWVQRIAQDWLVLDLTGSATAVGVTTALQLLPTVALGVVGGLIADRYPKRRILLATQVGMAALAACLAVLTLTGRVEVWHIYLLATGLGLLVAVDKPTQQALVTELVGTALLRRAVGLHASVFQLGALVGPAVSGLLIHLVGTGWAFGVNAASFAAPVITLLLIRDDVATGSAPTTGRSGDQLREGLRHVRRRKDVLWPIVLAGIFGLFTLNLPITLASYATEVFDSGATGYALLSTLVAVGSLSGALLSARVVVSKLRSIVTVALLLSTGYVAAAVTPNLPAFCVLLVLIGASTTLLLASASSTVQLATHASVRGRVIGVYLFVFLGSGAAGGPVLGLLAESFGPDVAMLLSGVVPGVATLLVAWKLAQLGRLRLRLTMQVVIAPR